MELSSTVVALGGFATTRSLLLRGATEGELTEAVRGGELKRARRGWYSTLPPTDPRFRAVRVGGRLTGASAIDSLGGWVWNRPSSIQVAVRPGASRLRVDAGVSIRWESDDEAGGSDSVVGIESALVQVVLDADLETAVGCLDWALHTGKLGPAALARVAGRLPERARGILSLLDRNSESVLESVARVRLSRRGWAVVSQVPVGRGQRIDLVVDDSVGLELDGFEFHAEKFEEDRAKDQLIAIEGRHAIRVSAAQVRYAWPRVERAIIAALRARGRAVSGNSVTPAPTLWGARRHPTTNPRKTLAREGSAPDRH